jgi:hypothetical protein
MEAGIADACDNACDNACDVEAGDADAPNASEYSNNSGFSNVIRSQLSIDPNRRNPKVGYIV